MLIYKYRLQFIKTTNLSDKLNITLDKMMEIVQKKDHRDMPH